MKCRFMVVHSLYQNTHILNKSMSVMRVCVAFGHVTYGQHSDSVDY